jgi:6-phosphogluconolactonase (cycloisomerase 2 family)
MAVNGKYLFGSDTNGSNVDSFLMSSTGALSQVDTFDVSKYTADGCQQPMDVTLDHTGSTLYAFSAFYGTNTPCPTEPVFQSLQVNKSTGALTFLGNTNANPAYSIPLRFTPANVFAYEASSTDIFGFKRQSNGDLVYYDTTKTLPHAPAGHMYGPNNAAADPDNHLAVVLGDYSTTNTTVYPTRVAVYTASSTGTLTTSSTASNMPKLAIGLPYYSNMSPSGKLLAVSGQKGLQVLLFNGASQATAYTGVLVSTSIDKIFWDNANHLYAISSLGSKLYVFTVTPTSVSQAPGSPYPVFHPDGLIVQPK